MKFTWIKIKKAQAQRSLNDKKERGDYDKSNGAKEHGTLCNSNSEKKHQSTKHDPTECQHDEDLFYYQSKYKLIILFPNKSKNIYPEL